MKKLYILFFCISQIFIFGQSQDLANLAKGDYLGFNAIYDQKDNLYGYLSLYGYGKSGDKTKKFEYVILDKNLNPIANKEFEGDITTRGYYGYMDFNGKIILAPDALDGSLIKNRDFFYPTSMEIDLKENNAKRKLYYDYDHGNFKEINQPKNYKEGRKEDKTEKKEKGYNYESSVFEIKEGGFLAVEFNDYGSYVNNNNLIKFDENKKEMWRFRYNTSGDKKINETLRILEKDEKYIYCMLQNTTKKSKLFHLLVLDMQTGKEVAKNPIFGLTDDTIENITSYGTSYYDPSIDNDKTFDDKIVMVGRNFETTQSNGFARMLIDRKDFQVYLKALNYEDMKQYIPTINKTGVVENGYVLKTKDFFFLEDGSVGILMEKYKPEGQYNAPKTTDLVYAYTDRSFNLKGLQVFDKEKTKWANNDYLFSQYLNDGKDVAFFYRDLQKDDKTKEKNWELFINTLIDGNFKQEKVQISEKEKYTTYPYVAKEGYILLREINEKEKFNKIRLERLNY